MILNITKIQLALNAIGYMAQRHNEMIESIPVQESTIGMINGGLELEEEFLKKLIDIAEDFGNAMDSSDMLNKVDESVLNPIYDILYNRVDEDEEEIKTNV